MENTKERIEKVLSAVLGEKTSVDNDTRFDDIDDLESMEFVDLIDGVEREFGMKFRMREVSSMKTIGEMIAIIEKSIDM